LYINDSLFFNGLGLNSSGIGSYLTVKIIIVH
jgi:hypothetical protein